MVRKGRLSGNDPFASESTGTRSLHETDGNLFGIVDEGKVSYQPVNIFEVHPDPIQPRRAMPSVIRSRWDGNAESIARVFEIWLQLVEQASAP